MDESAPENILEATARAMRFYLDVSAEVWEKLFTILDELLTKSQCKDAADLSNFLFLYNMI